MSSSLISKISFWLAYSQNHRNYLYEPEYPNLLLNSRLKLSSKWKYVGLPVLYWL